MGSKLSFVAKAKSREAKIFYWLAVCNYVQAAISFIANIWLANKLGASGYGIVSYAIVASSFVTTIVLFASDRIIVRDLVRSKNPHEVLTASIVMRIGISLVVGMLCLPWLLAGHLGDKMLPTAIALVWGALLGLQPTGWFDFRFKMGLHATITLIERIIYIVMISLVLQYSALSIQIVYCMLISRVIGLIIQWIWVFKTYKIATTNLLPNIRNLLISSWPITIAALASMLMTHANQLILATRNGASQLACYFLAVQIISMVQLVQSQIVRIMAPKIADIVRPGRSTVNMRKFLILFSSLGIVTTAVLTLPLGVFCPYLIKILFKAEYAATIGPLRILCIWCTLYGAGLIINQYLICLNLNIQYCIQSILAGFLAIVLGLYFVDIAGVLGVALALLISHSLAMGLQFIIVWKSLSNIQLINHI